MSRGWIYSSLPPKEFHFLVLMLPQVFRNHICCFQPNTWTSLWGTLSRPSNPSLTGWHHEITTSSSTADRCALKVALMFRSWKLQQRREEHQFGFHLPEVTKEFIFDFFPSRSSLLDFFFFMFGFQNKPPISYFWERAGGEKHGASTHSFT